MVLFHIQEKIVTAAPVNKKFHLLSVVLLLTVLDETYHCCVVRILNDVICIVLSTTDMGHQGVK